MNVQLLCQTFGSSFRCVKIKVKRTASFVFLFNQSKKKTKKKSWQVPETNKLAEYLVDGICKIFLAIVAFFL